MEYLTIRDIPLELSTALEAERRRRGLSLEATVVELLRQSLALGVERNNRLSQAASTRGKDEGQSLDSPIPCADQFDDLGGLLAATSGIWRGEDGLVYQERLRGEWDDR